MGEGYEYQCQKCKKRYRINFGRGMNYTNLYSAAVNEIRAGKYGKRIKSAFEEQEDLVIINPEYVVYQCPICGKWKNQRDVTLYKAGTEVGEKRIIKKYEAKCRRCNMPMVKIDGKDLLSLPCPKCHYLSGIEGVIEIVRWD